MVALRSLLRFLPFLSSNDPRKRQFDGDASDNTLDGTFTTVNHGLPSELAVPLHAPLEPATTRCYSKNSCVDFSYPAVILQAGANVAQAVCPTSSKIVITFTNHAAFLTAQNWPMANLVLVGQGYPGCGPTGADEGARFYAITKSVVANAKSRSITAHIVYVDRNEVTVSEPETPGGASVTTQLYTITERVTVDGVPTTIYSTVTTVSTLVPALVSSTPQSSFSTSISPPAPSPSVEPGCQSDSDGFYTDDLGITYQALCSFWNGGEQIDSFGPGYTAESCLNACSMMLPQCAGVVFSIPEGGYCSLQRDFASQSRSRFGYYSYERVSGQGNTNSGSPEPESSSTVGEPTPSPSTPSEISSSLPFAGEIPTITATPSSSAEENSGESSVLPLPLSSESTPEPTAEASATDVLPSLSSDISTLAPVSPSPTPSGLCPYNDNDIFIDLAGYGYNVSCNADMPGGDLGDPLYGLATEQDCLAACDSTSGCVGTVFASDSCSDNWCHCFLKNAIEPAVFNSNYNSYVRVSGPQDTSRTTNPDCPADDNKTYVGADGTQFEIRCDLDLRGSGVDNGRTVQTSLQACIDACDALGTDACYGVSWVPAGQDQQWCYYKVPADPWVPVPDLPGLVVDSARVVQQ